MMLLKEWWRWFGRQSRLNKFIIVGFSASLVLFLVPLAVSWFKPTPIHVGVAFYTYERAFLLEETPRRIFMKIETSCPIAVSGESNKQLPKGRAKTPAPQSWVVIKFLIENVSGHRLTNLRLEIKSPLLQPTTTLFTTENLEATGSWDSSGKGGSRKICDDDTGHRTDGLSRCQPEDAYRRGIASGYLCGP